MAVINEQGVRRNRVSVTRAGSTPVGSTPVGSTPVGSAPVSSTPVSSTPVGSTVPRRASPRTTSNGIRVSAVPRTPGIPPAPQRVTHLRRRPAPAELPEQLPLAVGFGSTVDLPPCRLWAVPGSPVDFVPLPAVLDDGSSEGGWSDGGRLNGGGRDDERSPSVVRPAVLEFGANVPKCDRADADAGAKGIGIRTHSSVIVGEAAPLHLTARGRAVLLLLAGAVGVAVVVFAWFGAGSSAAPARAVQPAQVTVHDGDTLWSIAGKVAPNHDPRAVVARLLQLNHLRSPNLVPGQVLLTR